MKLREVKAIETPYAGIDIIAYTNEKKRLQVELLNIQQRIIEEKDASLLFLKDEMPPEKVPR